MALSEEESADIARRYREGEEVMPLATAFRVSDTAIRNHLRKHGVELRTAIAETDEDLGIGAEADGSTPVDLATLLANPTFEAIVERAVQAKLAQMGAATRAAPASPDTPSFDDFMRTMERFVEAQEVQRPGYQKALSADQVETRAQGHARMDRLIEHARATGARPHWIVGPGGFYGPSPSGPILFAEGSEIISYLPPAEDFLPVNEVAGEIMQAFQQWIGGPSRSIGELIADAMLTAKGHEPAMVTSEKMAGANDVELIDAKAVRHDVRPKRVMGTVVPERHGEGMPGQPNMTQQPKGPVFVGEAA